MVHTHTTVPDLERFTLGDCHFLAHAIEKLTGWEMHCFVDGCDVPIDHAFVITPDGRALDVQGLHTLDDLCSRWGQWSHRACVMSELYWGPGKGHSPRYGNYSFLRASVLAKRLVEEYKTSCLSTTDR